MNKEQALQIIERMFTEHDGSDFKLGLLVGYIRAFRHTGLLTLEEYLSFLERTVSLKHG